MKKKPLLVIVGGPPIAVALIVPVITGTTADVTTLVLALTALIAVSVLGLLVWQQRPPHQ